MFLADQPFCLAIGLQQIVEQRSVKLAARDFARRKQLKGLAQAHRLPIGVKARGLAQPVDGRAAPHSIP